ncbi:MAG: ATP-binding protein, partial [Lacisediminimonas sp.]|nr:ATP-binding protein [Lacisediminimonas sp.]
ADNIVGKLVIPTDHVHRGLGPAGMAFREGSPHVASEIAEDPVMAPWLQEARRHGWRSSAAFPIRQKGNVCGVLTVHANENGFFEEREVGLLTEAALDVSFALDNFLLEEERLQAEAVVQKEQAFSQAMIDSMPGIVYFYNEEGRFLRWNKNFETVSGYSGEEIATMHPLQFFSGADQATLAERIAQVFEAGEASVEALFLAKDGVATPYFLTGRRLMFGGMRCLVGVGINISKRQLAEQALRELNETLEHRIDERTAQLQDAVVRAEAADRLKSAFLATMSHELRTPLNSIIGFTGVVLQELPGPLNPEQAKQLGMVRNSARHLLELINDVLDLSKIEAGQLEMRRAPLVLSESIYSVVDSIRPLAEKKGLALVVDPLPAMPGMVGDRRRVEQILLNLLSNAIKFTDRGQVRLSVATLSDFRANPAASPAMAVRLKIADTGIGIRPDQLDYLFQPFLQLDSGLARQHEGTGLGLAICRRLAVLMGGEVTASSAWSVGSEFTVTIPLHPH